MVMLLILLFFTLVFARMSSCYDSRISRSGYVTVKNAAIAKLLIDKCFFAEKGKCTLKKDRNRMSVAGFVFYLSVILVILLQLILYIVPQIPCEPLEINTTKIYLHADVLNEKLPLIAAIVLMCTEFLYFSFLLFRRIHQIEQSWMKAFVGIVSIFLGLSSFAIIVQTLLELVKW